MRVSIKAAASAAVAFSLAGPGLATAWAQAPSNEAAHQSSNMGPATGNKGDANNGVGTDGSLEQDHGKASSTVAGMGGKAAVGGGNTGKVSGGAVESDPAQGGGTQSK